MNLEQQDFWALTNEIIEKWWSPLTSNDGFPIDQIRAAEKKLGILLPASLIHWYVAAGKRPDLINAYNYFYAPSKLIIRNQVLEFCMESQGNIYWGIRISDLASPDPPVLATLVDYTIDTIEIPSFSFFIFNMITWLTSLLKSSNHIQSVGTPDKDTLETLYRNFIYAGYSSFWPEDESQLFYGKFGIVSLWNDYIHFVTLNDMDFEKGMKMVKANWERIISL